MVLEMMSTVRHMMGAGSWCGSMPRATVRSLCPGGSQEMLWVASLILITSSSPSVSMVSVLNPSVKSSNIPGSSLVFCSFSDSLSLLRITRLSLCLCLSKHVLVCLLNLYLLFTTIFLFFVSNSDNYDCLLSCGFFPAASFMSFQQCEFNFGWRPFLHPPSSQFSVFNDQPGLSEEEKVILPRPLKMQAIRQLSVKENACSLCFDQPASVQLLPCQHK